jgi:hypothetical protein
MSNVKNSIHHKILMHNAHYISFLRQPTLLEENMDPDTAGASPQD